MKTRAELSAREVDELQTSLVRRLGDTSVPTLPQVAVRVIELVSDPKSSLNQFAEVIRTDQALTGRILRMSNSAFFAQREPVTRIERATVMLGLDRIKAVALGFHLSKIAASDDGEFSTKRMWTQSLFRAWAAFRLAEMYDRTVTGEAFVVGLMADAGLPMMAKLAGESFGKVVNPSDPPAKQYLSEFKSLPFTHVDVIQALCQMWKLPPLLTKAICGHHRPAGAVSKSNKDSILHGVAYFTGSLSLDKAGKPTPEGTLATLGHKLFNKEPAELERIMVLAANDFKASREIFAQILDDKLNVDAILERANEELSESVETLVEESIAAEGGEKASRFDLGDMILEMERCDANRVTVFIADSSGNRIVSEQVNPKSQSREEICQRLLLSTAEPDVVASIFTRLSQLAA